MTSAQSKLGEEMTNTSDHMHDLIKDKARPG